MPFNCFSKNKYGASKVTFQGITFDSKVEMQRYLYLKDMERKGEISGLRRQVKFEIIPKVTKEFPKQLKTKVKYETRVVEKATSYTCDFLYKEKGKYVIEDVKNAYSQDIRDYPLRRKLMVQKIYTHNAKGRGQWIFREAVLKGKKLEIKDR